MSAQLPGHARNFAPGAVPSTEQLESRLSKAKTIFKAKADVKTFFKAKFGDLVSDVKAL